MRLQCANVKGQTTKRRAWWISQPVGLRRRSSWANCRLGAIKARARNLIFWNTISGSCFAKEINRHDADEEHQLCRVLGIDLVEEIHCLISLGQTSYRWCSLGHNIMRNLATWKEGPDRVLQIVTSCIQLIAQLFAHCPVRHREQRLGDVAGVKNYHR